MVWNPGGERTHVLGFGVDAPGLAARQVGLGGNCRRNPAPRHLLLLDQYLPLSRLSDSDWRSLGARRVPTPDPLGTSEVCLAHECGCGDPGSDSPLRGLAHLSAGGVPGGALGREGQKPSNLPRSCPPGRLAAGADPRHRGVAWLL